MKCPKCGDLNSSIIDSRPVNQETGTRRRWKCRKNHRWSTRELIFPGRPSPLLSELLDVIVRATRREVKEELERG